MNPDVRGRRLSVPGATLYHEVIGTGPVLLCLPGGPTDAASFASLADRLADRFTVVTHDPRGLSRSPVTDPDAPWSVELAADDAAALLASSTDEPAFVLGGSSGALVGLALLARHPARVRRLVAHEPPATSLLDDADVHAREGAEVYEVYRAEGAFAAMATFARGAGLEGSGPPSPQTPEEQEVMGRVVGNFDFFLGAMWRPLGAHRPDVEALRGAPVDVVVGQESAGQVAERAARALAADLGIEPVVLPGDHGGYDGPAAADYAEHLAALLDVGVSAPPRR